jgi:hypothetical protein
MRRHPVVVVPVHNEITSACLHTFVTLGAQSALAAEPQVAEIRRMRHEIRHALHPVVQDDQFLVGIILA